jgi:hypothetical protein
MKQLKNIFIFSLLMSFVFPAHVFADSTPSQGLLPAKQVDNIKKALESKHFSTAKVYADAEKKHALTSEELLQNGAREMYMVFEKDQEFDQAFGIHLISDVNKDRNVKLSFEILSENFEDIYPSAKRSVIIDQNNPEKTSVLMEQAFRSAIASANKESKVGFLAKTKSNMLAKLLNFFIPSAKAGVASQFLFFATLFCALSFVYYLVKFIKTRNDDYIYYMMLETVLILFNANMYVQTVDAENFYERHK